MHMIYGPNNADDPGHFIAQKSTFFLHHAPLSTEHVLAINPTVVHIFQSGPI